jgi:hypothetical protein
LLPQSRGSGSLARIMNWSLLQFPATSRNSSFSYHEFSYNFHDMRWYRKYVKKFPWMCNKCKRAKHRVWSIAINVLYYTLLFQYIGWKHNISVIFGRQSRAEIQRQIPFMTRSVKTVFYTDLKMSLNLPKSVVISWVCNQLRHWLCVFQNFQCTSNNFYNIVHSWHDFLDRRSKNNPVAKKEIYGWF